MNYKDFLHSLDQILQRYFIWHKDFINCKIGCSDCCKSGTYPMSQLEFDYIMQGFIELDEPTKLKIKFNIDNMTNGGGICPFLINDKCSVYTHRPIICRVHGLAYKTEKIVKVPYCANNGKNYAKVYNGKEIIIEPILKNLDTPEIIKGIEYGEIRDMYDWLK